MRLLGSILAAVALLPGPGAAQSAGGLRIGGAIGVPGRVLNAGPGSVGLGLGVALEGAWLHGIAPRAAVAYHARITSAPVVGKQAGAEWDSGRALLIDAAIRFERDVSDRVALFIGPGLSHWAGPDDVAPFAGAGSALVGAEAGVHWRPTARAWRATLTSRLTRVGPDEAREQRSGFTFRWLIGVQHAR